jgi:predicted ATP-binding protein involved in virulence
VKVNRLQVKSLRVFKQADLKFVKGMNLLVGINGVGKTTVLDALRICFSKILPQVTASKSRSLSFAAEDITGIDKAMTVQVSFELASKDFVFLVHKQREQHLKYKPGNVREETLATPDQEKCLPELSVLGAARKKAEKQPIVILFSTRRSLVSDAAPSSGSASGGQAGAFADALANRELRLTEIAYWMRAQEEIGREDPSKRGHLSALQLAASRFLPKCKNLHVEASPKPRLVVDKGRMKLDVRQLSDGERGMLAIVLDLARRLSQANPGLTDPVKQGEAVVLIDELDLHLHPKWQRVIVERLTKTFSNCQFIATTHSPQIVASVEPEQVLLLTDIGIVRPQRSLGMDSNWILQYLMEANDRPAMAAKAIRQVEALIKRSSFKKARTEIEVQRREGLDLPEWSILEARMARIEVIAK